MWSQAPADRLRSRTTWALLAMILVAALGVRLWYASHRLDDSRFWDEQYALSNVRSILGEGTLQPVSSYYPSPVFNLPAAALLAASERLHAVTGWRWLDAIGPRSLEPTGYMLLRGLQSLFGAAAVSVSFLLGRLLFGRAAGLIAALIVAFMPWQIHASGYFKPDALLVLTTLLALYWSARAILSPGRGRAALAGVGVALAASAKLTGVLTAVPLTVGLLLLARHSWRRLAELALAGAVAAAAFALMNPYWRAYPSWAAGLKADYVMRARWHDMSGWQIPGRTLEFLADPFTLGLPGTALALVGMLVLVACLRRTREPGRQAALLAVAGFPPLWMGAYALQTPYFKSNNMLPITPVLALLLAAVLVAAWDLARSRWQGLRAPAAPALALTVLAWVWVRPGLLYTYDSVTPSTLEMLSRRLERHGVLEAGRLVLFEPGVRPARWRTGRLFPGRAATVEIEDLTGVSGERRRGADALVFPATRLLGAAGDRHRAILGSHLQRRMVRVDRRLGRLRGPSLIARVTPWAASRRPIRIDLRRCGNRCWSAVVPAAAQEGEVGSLVLWLETHPYRTPRPPRLLLAGRELTPYPARMEWRAHHYGTDRFRLDDEPGELRIEGGRFARRLAVALHRWLPPRDPPRVSAGS